RGGGGAAHRLLRRAAVLTGRRAGPAGGGRRPTTGRPARPATLGGCPRLRRQLATWSGSVSPVRRWASSATTGAATARGSERGRGRAARGGGRGGGGARAQATRAGGRGPQRGRRAARWAAAAMRRPGAPAPDRALGLVGVAHAPGVVELSEGGGDGARRVVGL